MPRGARPSSTAGAAGKPGGGRAGLTGLGRRRSVAAAVLGLVIGAVALGACDSRVGAGDPRFVVTPPTSEAADRTGRPPTDLTGAGVDAAAETPRRPVGGVYPGTDRFVDTAPASARASSEGLPAAADGAVTLNFVDTDLREVVKAVLGDILGRNYVIDPAVQGTVTMQTSRPLGRAELLAAVEELLIVNDAAMVDVDGIYKIIPADRAARAGAAVTAGAPRRLRSGSELSIVPLRHVSATEMATVLEPFAPPNAVLRVDPDRNLLVVGGTLAQRRQLLELIETFDVDWLAGMSYAIHPVGTTSAETMVEDLRKVFRSETAGPAAGVVEFVPIERLNAVLVISPRREYLAKAATWIDRLDVGDNSEPRVYVYYVQNSRAEDLADVLGQIFGGVEAASPTRRQLAPGLTPTELTSPDRRDTLRRSRRVSDRYETGGGPGDEAVSLAGLGPDGSFYQVTPTPGEPGPDAGPGTMRQGGRRADPGIEPVPTDRDVRIIADPIKNALVIQATPRDYRKIQSVLEKLDIQSLQVLIEATFIEVSLTDDLVLGTEWFFNTGDSDLSLDNLTSGLPGTAGFFAWSLVTNNGNLRVTLRALQNLTEVTVVSSPNLMVLDNQEARIQVGGEEPVPTQSRQSIADPDAPIVSNIEYREVGTILSVTPRVNAGGLVTLDIEQEVSDVQDEQVVVGGTTAPAFDQRVIQSTIAVHDGESVVLGGQIFENKQKSKRGVPFLSQVPVLGLLFGTNRDASDRTELLVIITPRVVGDEGSARIATETLNRRMQRLRPLLERFRVREGLDGA